MKKLQKLKLHNVAVMNETEMKNIVGGYSYGIEATSCSTTCYDGHTIEITDCIGTCTAADEKHVTCKGKTTEITKYC